MKKFTNIQIRRMGYPLTSKYCIVKTLPFGEFFIGRTPNPPANFLNLPSTFTSKNHCRIECHEDGRIFLHDTSTNGTFVNGIKYHNESVKLKIGYRIGIGFPLNESNAQTNKNLYGFVVELVHIKREVKQEDGSDEEGELVIDESVQPEPETPLEFQEKHSPEAIANGCDAPDDIPIKIEQNYDADDDFGNYTDDDDDVIFIGQYESKESPREEIEDVKPQYLEQFSQVGNNLKEQERYNDTQALLDDLKDSPLQEIPIPSPPPPVSTDIVNGTPCIINDPIPLTSIRITPNVILNKKPSTSKVPNRISRVTTDQIPLTSNAIMPSLNTNPIPLISKVPNGISRIISDPKPSTSNDITPNVTLNPSPASSNVSNGREKPVDEPPETVSVETNTDSIEKNTDSVGTNTDTVELLQNIDLEEILNRLVEIHGRGKLIEKLEPKEKVSEKRSDPKKLIEDTSFLKEKSSKKESERNEKTYKHRRNSSASKSSKEKKIEKRRSSSHHKRKSKSPEPREPSTEPVINEEVPPLIIKRVTTPPPNYTEAKPERIAKRRASEFMEDPSKRQKKLEVSDQIKRLRPVPDPKPIEECFSNSQLPPPLEVVPEPKEPEFQNKLFHKNVHRVAHNKVPKETTKESEKPKKSWLDVNKNKKKDESSGGGFKIPKIIERLERSKSPDDIMELLEKIDDAVADNPNKNDPTERQTTPPPAIESSPYVSSPSDLEFPPEFESVPDIDSLPVFTPAREPNDNELFQRREYTRRPREVAPGPHVFAVPQIPPRQMLPQIHRDPPRQDPRLVISRDPPIQDPRLINSRDPPIQDPRLINGLVSAILKPPTLVPYDCRNILADMLNWEVGWIGSFDPPIVGHNLSCVTDSFPSHAQYVSTFVPLLKLELFESIQDPYSRTIDKRFPVSVQTCFQTAKSKFNFDSLALLRFEMSTEIHKKNEEIRYGTLVIIYSNSKESCFGLIHKVSDLNEKRSFSTVDIWLSKTFPAFRRNERKFDICFLAYIKVELETFLSLHELSHSKLLPLILNPRSIDFNCTVESPSENMGMDVLNGEQYKSTCLITDKLARESHLPHIFVIEGPPGTGKSRLIANLILHLYRCPDTADKKLRILLCAPSNNAVDLLTEKLMDYRKKLKTDQERKILKLVRFGDKIGMSVWDHSIASLQEQPIRQEFARVADTFAPESNDHKIRKGLQKDIIELEKNLKLFPTNDPKILEKFKNMKKGLHELERKMYFKMKTEKDYGEFKYKTKLSLIDGANVVSCTLNSCPSLSNQSRQPFDMLIIDEATQATETACLMALNFGVKHLIMIGDTQQLPAMVRNQKAKELGLEQSLFARIRKAADKPLLSLQVQYRMHPEILRFSNYYFYNNRVRNDLKTITDYKPNYRLKPYLVWELDSEQNLTQNPHCYNTDEIDFVVKLVETVKALVFDMEVTIGIVTPYAKQKHLIEDKLARSYDNRISVSTIDGIQGQEKDIIIFSCVRTEGVGFLSKPERLNVALTRARKSMYICGNFQSLRHVVVWDELLKDAQNRNVLIDTSLININNLSEYLLNDV